MNRKQKKAKRLNATAHTKKQATVYLTQKEKQDIADRNSYSDWDDELLAVEQDSQSFINKVKTAFYMISFFVIAYLVWCNW
jgi:hypothetical protein